MTVCVHVFEGRGSEGFFSVFCVHAFVTLLRVTYPASFL